MFTGSACDGHVSAGRDHRRALTAALWFTEENGNKIGRITTGGARSRSSPTGLSSGASRSRSLLALTGACGSRESGAEQDRRASTTGGTITEFSGSRDCAAGRNRRSARTGTLWFTESGRQPDRQDDTRRAVSPTIAPDRHQRPRRHHGRAGRQALVHRRGRRQDRRASRRAQRDQRHQSLPAGRWAERSLGHHDGRERFPVVHGVRGNQIRRISHHRRRSGQPTPVGAAAFGHRDGCRPGALVHGDRRRAGSAG